MWGGCSRIHCTLVLAGLMASSSLGAQMSLPASFAVSPQGAATYSVPIQIPPGIGGVEPTLALGYNSQSTNGTFGVGWALSGLSAIERCPQTYPQDGALTGVNYSFSDRVCFDGQANPSDRVLRRRSLCSRAARHHWPCDPE